MAEFADANSLGFAARKTSPDDIALIPDFCL